MDVRKCKNIESFDKTPGVCPNIEKYRLFIQTFPEFCKMKKNIL